MNAPLKKALVIDDVESNRRVAAALLEWHGFEVQLADNARAGLDLIRAEPFDVLLLDISMPGLNGMDLCKKIRQDPAMRSMHIVAYTAHVYPEDKAEILQAGFNALLTKPISVQSLREALHPVVPRA